ncbi:MAG TPA: metalloregulator ArsR/SmtB family transcription factor [Terriglobia bacterium]|nr:metalloregulator ArsR/SmtB family transcription factor [Terriglobia bacterium]
MRELEMYFKGLADGTRLRILNLLLWGELCGCDIQVVLETSQPNASRHLTYLKHAGLVRDRRDGYRVFYGLAEPQSEALKGLLDYLRNTFKNDPALRNDLVRLKQAIKDGACMFQQIRPLPRVMAAP